MKATLCIMVFLSSTCIAISILCLYNHALTCIEWLPHLDMTTSTDTKPHTPSPFLDSPFATMSLLLCCCLPLHHLLAGQWMYNSAVLLCLFIVEKSPSIIYDVLNWLQWSKGPPTLTICSTHRCTTSCDSWNMASSCKVICITRS